MEDRFLNTLTFLTAIVVEQTESIASQQHDGDEVAGRQEGHEEVDDVPDELEAGECAKDDNHAS